MSSSDKEFFIRLAHEERDPKVAQFLLLTAEAVLPGEREWRMAQVEQYRRQLLRESTRHAPRGLGGVLKRLAEAERRQQEKESVKDEVLQRESLQKQLDEAQTLGELGARALRYLMEQAGIGPEWFLPLKKRLAWVDGVDWTLQTAGELIGVTRERVRQVTRKVEDLEIGVTASPKVFWRVLSAGRSAESMEAFFSALEDQGLADPDDQWNQESLMSIFVKLGRSDVQDQLASVYRRLSPPPPSSARERLLRSERTKLLGLFSVADVASKSGLDADEVLAAYGRIYSYVFTDGELGIAISKPPGTFLSIVGRQLLVNPDAGDHELFIGLQRFEQSRKLPRKLQFEGFSSLLRVVFGDPPKLQNAPAELRSLISLGDFETEVLKVFEASGRNLLHREELIRVSKALGISPISAGVYLSSSPVLRPSESRRGYFRLV